MISDINISVENWKLILIRYILKYVHIYIHTYNIRVYIIENLSYKENIWTRPMIRVNNKNEIYNLNII